MRVLWDVSSGTKDKRGATCQYVTLFNIAPERLEKLNQK